MFISLYCFSQNEEVDNKYREDQIYFGLYYNSLLENPSDFNQNKFSSSLNVGFIRDFPFNQGRNFGIGIGLGLSTSSYSHNLKLINENNQFNGILIDDYNSFNKNKWILMRLKLLLKLDGELRPQRIINFGGFILELKLVIFSVASLSMIHQMKIILNLVCHLINFNQDLQ